MTKEVQQFTELVRQEHALIQYGKLEREQVLLNIRAAELNGEITPEQAQGLREQYQ